MSQETSLGGGCAYIDMTEPMSPIDPPPDMESDREEDCDMQAEQQSEDMGCSHAEEEISATDFNVRINQDGMNWHILTDALEMRPPVKATARYGNFGVNRDPNMTSDINEDVNPKTPWAIPGLGCVTAYVEFAMRRSKKGTFKCDFALEIEEKAAAVTSDDRYLSRVGIKVYKNPQFEVDNDCIPRIKNEQATFTCEIEIEDHVDYYTFVTNVLKLGVEKCLDVEPDVLKNKSKIIHEILTKERTYKHGTFYPELLMSNVHHNLPGFLTGSRALRGIDFGFVVVDGHFPGCHMYFPPAQKTLLSLVDPKLAKTCIPDDVDFVDFNRASVKPESADKHREFSKKLHDALEADKVEEHETELSYVKQGGGRYARNIPEYYLVIHRTVPEDEVSSFPSTGNPRFPEYVAAPAGHFLSCMLYVDSCTKVGENASRNAFLEYTSICVEVDGMQYFPQFHYVFQDRNYCEIENRDAVEDSELQMGYVQYKAKPLYTSTFVEMWHVLHGQEPLDPSAPGLLNLVKYFMGYPHKAADFSEDPETPRANYGPPTRVEASRPEFAVKSEILNNEEQELENDWSASEGEVEVQAQNTGLQDFDEGLLVMVSDLRSSVKRPNHRFDGAMFDIKVEEVFDSKHPGLLDIHGFDQNQQFESRLSERLQDKICVWHKKVIKLESDDGASSEPPPEKKKKLVPVLHLAGMKIISAETSQGAASAAREPTIKFPNWKHEGQVIEVSEKELVSNEDWKSISEKDWDVIITDVTQGEPSVLVKTEVKAEPNEVQQHPVKHEESP